MKNNQIHEGFDKQDIRDFISMTFVQILEKETAIKPKIVKYDNKYPFEYEIKKLEEEISITQQRLILAKQKNALYQIMVIQGWTDVDVSDCTLKDNDNRFFMNFIGTKDEHNELLKKIRKEE